MLTQYFLTAQGDLSLHPLQELSCQTKERTPLSPGLLQSLEITYLGT